jgi:hypothetical protein
MHHVGFDDSKTDFLDVSFGLLLVLLLVTLVLKK